MDIVNYIEGKYREIKPYEDIESLKLYSWVNQSQLKNIFSTVHHLMVKNYSPALMLDLRTDFLLPCKLIA